MASISKRGYQYLKSVVLKPYKQNHRNFFIFFAVVIFTTLAYLSWNFECYYRDYKQFYRAIRREAYCEPALFEYGVGQHDVRKSFSRFAAKQRVKPLRDGPSMPLYWRSIQTIRDFKNFLRMALREKFDPASTLAMSRRYLRTMEHNLNRMLPAQVLRTSSVTLENLRRRILSTLHDLQNPSNCRDVINCKITTESGISSGLHEVLYCLVLGLQRNKTVALSTSEWHNFAKTPWHTFFLNLGSCPTAPDNEDVNLSDEYRVNMKFLPASFGEYIINNHGDPYAWWYGVLMAYILRPSESMESLLDAYLRKETGGRPYVAIHIRRTDKRGEALYRPLESYLAEAEEYFARLSLTEDLAEKLVYVATDDPSILDDLDTKFKSYKFISNKEVASEAHSYSERRKASAVLGIMKDYHMLSHANHLVCTLSSGFCRLAYELMSGIRNDAWSRISSLDNDFYYAYVLQQEREVAEPYEDGVFVAEIRNAYTSAVPESLQQMIKLTLAKSYSPFGANGFVYTNDVRRSMAMFKTLPSFPMMSYNSSISRINA